MIKKIKCDCCGKFIDLKDPTKFTTAFVPDSEFTIEEFLFRCEKCTKKYGKCESVQTMKYK